MPINQMAWVASSTGFLLMAGTSLMEVPRAADPAAIKSVAMSIAANQNQTLPFIQLASSTLASSTLASSTLASSTLSSSTLADRGDQDKSAPAGKLSAGKLSIGKLSLPTDKLPLLNCPSSADKVWTQPTPGMFPVFLRGCLVAELINPMEARSLQQRLSRLSQDPQTNWQKLQPGLVGTQPVGRLGPTVLFTVSTLTADRLNQHAHDLAVQWTNRIRQVMGASPIALATAQQAMYSLQETPAVTIGAASWYGPYFHGRMTANGETFDQYDLTAAHRDLPLGSFVKVKNRHNGRTVVVRINDRGPYYDEDHRVIDLSYQAARILGGEEKGVMAIELTVLKSLPSAAIAQLSLPPLPVVTEAVVTEAVVTEAITPKAVAIESQAIALRPY
jgi:rare lipoprotein A (peptidoglycan hydrolase)